MARRQHLTLTFVLVLVAFCTLSYLFSGPSGSAVPGFAKAPAGEPLKANEKSEFVVDLNAIPTGFLEGESIAPRLENATLKAELGHATWKFLHTMMSRFPDEPSKDDRMALETFMHLFARLYPCGQCAKHFRGLLVEYPPQTSSRNAAAGWLCFMHNIVNEKVHKPLFDCNKIGDFYDCGCGDDKKKEGVQGVEGGKGDKGSESAQGDGPDPELHKH
ncbi:ERV/ALR sulfhydryl oxidase domain-containing protein [Ilyonectria sp. MPI-CAGE-AT-0026]|nr:ERV/ALR sulfhydryl oxidase domain-containing protein [Ilyonectria sp. MPI-CAGE-AT-0026]